MPQLSEALSFAREHSLPVFILGEGSNVLVSDEGFAGLVIKLSLTGIDFEEKDNDVVHATVGAGENWDNFVCKVISQGLYGIENLSGIPGTIGATPIQNIGAYGVEVADTIVSVEALDPSNDNLVIFSNAECQFGYRDSLFKTRQKKNYIITRVCYRLTRRGKLNISYKDIIEYNAQHTPIVSLTDMRQAILTIRANKFPDLSDCRTAGSFFKNPVLEKEAYNKLKEKFQGLPGYEMDDDRVKIALAWLLDRAGGWRGVRRGGVGAFERQPLVLLNYRNATASDVLKFAEDMADDIKSKTHITIVPEVTFVGNEVPKLFRNQ